MVLWQVTLTWDETPHERVAFMARDFSKDELADQDLQDYVASDTDSDGMVLDAPVAYGIEVGALYIAS